VIFGEEDNTVDLQRRRRYHREQVKGNSTSDCLRQPGLADGLNLASPHLGTPWVRLQLSSFLGNSYSPMFIARLYYL